MEALVARDAFLVPAPASVERGRVAVPGVEFLAAGAAIQLPQIDEATALLVRAFLSVHRPYPC